MRCLGRVAGVLALACASCRSPAAPMRPVPVQHPAVLADAEKLRRAGRLDEAASEYARLDQKHVRVVAGLQQIALDRGLDLDVRRSMRNEERDGYLQGRIEADRQRRRSAFARASEPYRSLGLGDIERAVALDPGHSWLRVAAGRSHLARGALASAEADFLAALWSDPRHPGAAHGMSLVEDRRGNHAAALAWARRAFECGRGEQAFVERFQRVARHSSASSARSEAARSLAEVGERGLLLAGALASGAEAERLFALAKAAGASDSEVAAERGRKPSQAIGTFVARLRRAMNARYRHFAATGEAEDFDAFVDWARALYEECTGEALGARGPVEEYSFVGRLVDATGEAKEPLVRACARHGMLLVLGQRRGGPPEALMAHIVSREKGVANVRGARIEREVVRITGREVSGYVEWSGGGDIAGLAFTRLVIIDMDAIARWEGNRRRMRRRLERHRDAILAQEPLDDPDRTSVLDPAGVATRLELVCAGGVGGEIAVHEDAHLVDAALHLPVSDHLFRNLSLALRSGFSGETVLAYLERNAQLTALAEGPTPRGALATCCEALGGRGPHARGYGEIVAAIVREIVLHPGRYPGIDTERVIVQQLHRLTSAQVRVAAQAVARRWGLDSAAGE